MILTNQNYLKIFKIKGFLNSKIILIFIIILLSVIVSNNNTNELINIIYKSISDAYIQVSVFVASTLFIFYGAENILGINLSSKIKQARLSQVPICSALGSLPGCGGALLVVSQYTSGSISFGSVVAVLTSTMGDAAFLLLATEPQTGIFIILISFIAGSIFGWLVDITHPKNFLRKFKEKETLNSFDNNEGINFITKIWLLIFFPGIIFGIFTAFQYDLNLIFKNNFINNPITTLGFIGALLAVFMHIYASKGKIHLKTSFKLNHYINKGIADTNFVTLWVILAFLAFEVTIYLSSFDMQKLFEGMFILTPLVAIIIGFLPGCGPQIIVTSIYLMGIIPLSAQIGNAISNDGDALFPVLALAPKVGIIATLYSAIPAILVSYGYMLLFEI